MNHRFTRSCLAVAILSSAAPVHAQTGRLVTLEGGPVWSTPAGDDVRPEQRAAVEAAIGRYVEEFGWYEPEREERVPSLYTFFPMAGRLGHDVFARNMVDMDPANGAILDFNCTGYTYDGHLGHDIVIRGFAEKNIGVPVYAALDGRVVRTDDGHFDENGGGVPDTTDANYVVIDHGNQQIAYYWHLKKGSVAVTAGDEVVAGQQIGATASSGWSSWPHLHFETHVGTTVVEPTAGVCNPGASGWKPALKLKTSTYFDDFAFSHEPPPTSADRQLPWDMARTGQIAIGDPVLYFWFQVKSQPANAAWKVAFRMPDGSIAHEEEGAFATGFTRGAWWMFGFDVPAMKTVTGTWEMDFFLAGRSMGRFPIEVVEKRRKSFNRPPARVKVRFAAKRPRAGNVAICEVTTDLVLDDPDYDVVRFRYEWRVNDQVVRDVTTAAYSDVLRRDVFARGDKVRCTVSPSDGAASGPSSSKAKRVR